MDLSLILLFPIETFLSFSISHSSPTCLVHANVTQTCNFFFYFRINLPNLRGIEEHKYEAENCAKTRSNNRVPVLFVLYGKSRSFSFYEKEHLLPLFDI